MDMSEITMSELVLPTDPFAQRRVKATGQFRWCPKNMIPKDKRCEYYDNYLGKNFPCILQQQYTWTATGKRQWFTVPIETPPETDMAVFYFEHEDE